MKKTAKHTHVIESNGSIVFNNLHKLLLAQVESLVVTIIVIPEVMSISECADTLTITLIRFLISPVADGHCSSVTIPTVYSTVRLSSSSYPWITCPTCMGKRAMCFICYKKFSDQFSGKLLCKKCHYSCLIFRAPNQTLFLHKEQR